MFRLKFLIDVVAPALILCWAAICVYSAAAGESGFGALGALNRDVEEKRLAVDALRQRRLRLEARADKLNSKSLDADLADERIRAVLGYGREGDVIVTHSDLREALGGR